MAKLGTTYLVEYLTAGKWCFRYQSDYEDEAIELSRALWKMYGVQGVRVLKITTAVHKQAVKP
jgi:hypothetical protein